MASKTVKVRVLRAAMTGGGVLDKGQVVDVDEKLARSWVEAGLVELVEPAKAPAGKGK